MAKKFLAVAAGVVAVMAALVLLHGLFTQGESFTLEYRQSNFSQSEGGRYTAVEDEILNIRQDGSATYSLLNSQGVQITERQFSVSSDEMKVLRELFLNTGFMQIPDSEYGERQGLSNFTRYRLDIQSGDDSKSFLWVNPEASFGNIPSIIINAGTRLDAIIERHV
jgi:CHASE1-domain containing sensor protein